ncbi:unnamed protein product [Moneuplotes crassus]|uniref:Uncharacterized protein n=1 Tax=Euplotes crassus TaxID=5936 RepID=A0AAD1Y4Q7_EUPCR|nr:unnamed protein product [Moneuplotes crassus]
MLFMVFSLLFFLYFRLLFEHRLVEPMACFWSIVQSILVFNFPTLSWFCLNVCNIFTNFVISLSSMLLCRTSCIFFSLTIRLFHLILMSF